MLYCFYLRTAVAFVIKIIVIVIVIVSSTGDVLRQDGVRDEQNVVAVFDELGGGRGDAATRRTDSSDELPGVDVDDYELADDGRFAVDEFGVCSSNYQH